MQDIYFYNTLHRQKENFEPIKPGQATLYTCGPTVYDYAHIGNLRTYIFEDILRRILEFNGYEVNHAMNITDVGHMVGDSDTGEDKLEVGAQREGKTPQEIAAFYEQKFFDDLKQLNILSPKKLVRATEAIPQQIQLIQILLDKNYAYKTEQAIYFDTTKFPGYGQLSGQSLEEKIQGARDEVVTDSNKQNPQDFALWFFLKGRYAQHVLHWPSPWGDGFPGWHVECSAISRQLLGQPFDIHTGGVDHIGTHHTNEIAQSEAAYSEPLAHYWLHGEFLLVEGKRMGKSEGNFITLDTLREKGFHTLDFRYLCLLAHYRSKMNFTWEALQAARNARLTTRDFIASADGKHGDSSIEQNILHAFNDDLDTPKALALLHEAKNPSLWFEFEPILALGLGDEVSYLSGFKKAEVSEAIMRLVNEREEARHNKDWEKADKIRQEIEKLGIKVLDTPQGSRLVSKED